MVQSSCGIMMEMKQADWEYQLLDGDFGGAWGIHAADFDGDGGQ